MASVIEFLNQAMFSLGGTPVMLSELLGFVLGVATVWLVARNNIWTFPVGILQAGFFFVLFIETKLYTDAWLQVFFIAVQFLGWYAWLKAGPNRTALRVRNAPKWVWAIIVPTIALFVYLMVPVLRDAHGSYPGVDSTTTGLSVAAQMLMTFRYLQHWYLWIIADLLYIPLYFVKDLYFTSILYIVFLGICIHGLIVWRRIRDKQKVVAHNTKFDPTLLQPQPARPNAMSDAEIINRIIRRDE
jgi:nicotinamide mononucleotide transporter